MGLDQKRIGGIPVLGFGTWPLSDAVALKSVSNALEAGYRHIDTAQGYGNESEVGKAIAVSGIPRSDIFVTTKVAPGNFGAAQFAGSVKKSLDDLRLDKVDLLLLHWPPTDGSQIEAVVERLNGVAELGLAEKIGISNFPVAYMKRAVAASARKLSNNQVEFHPLLDQSKLKASADAFGIVLSAYCPIARGRVLDNPVVTAIAKRLGENPAAVVLAWIIQQGVIALPMTTKRENAEANFRALSITLTPVDMAAISALTATNKRVVAPAEMAALWD